METPYTGALVFAQWARREGFNANLHRKNGAHALTLAACPPCGCNVTIRLLWYIPAIPDNVFACIGVNVGSPATVVLLGVSTVMTVIQRWSR